MHYPVKSVHSVVAKRLNKWGFFCETGTYYQIRTPHSSLQQMYGVEIEMMQKIFVGSDFSLVFCIFYSSYQYFSNVVMVLFSTANTFKKITERGLSELLAINKCVRCLCLTKCLFPPFRSSIFPPCSLRFSPFFPNLHSVENILVVRLIFLSALPAYCTHRIKQA